MAIVNFPPKNMVKGRKHQMEDLIELLPIGVFRTNQVGRLTFANSHWLAIAGVSNERALGDSWMSTVHPLDRDVVLECWSTAITREEEFDLEFRFLSPAGKRTWVRGCARPEYNDETLAGFVGSISEITELKESQEQLLTTLNNLSDVVVLIGENGRILKINPAVESVFGYKPVELIGEHFAALVLPADREQVVSSFRRLLGQRTNTASLGVISFKGYTSSGEEVELEASIDASELADGQRGIIGVMRDVSERTRRERYITETQKMSALAQVTRGVSHEFSNLLNVMMGNLELLALRLDSDAIRQYIEPSLKAGERGGDLVQRLLAFNRQQPLSVFPLNIHDFMRELRQSVSAESGAGCDIRFDFMGNAAAVAVKVDPAYLQICMQQLLLNAQEAVIEPGLSGPDLAIQNKAVVDISVAEVQLDAAHQLKGYTPDKIGEAESGPYVRISIRDHGFGMDGNLVMRCIDPFFSTKTNHVGLGLSSVVGFVRQSGGFVSIESVKNSNGKIADQQRGTTVHLYLPRVSTHPSN